ncbi:MAG: hypothetical protein PVF82_13255 [Gammaproteobacteria bacterium]
MNAGSESGNRHSEPESVSQLRSDSGLLWFGFTERLKHRKEGI